MPKALVEITGYKIGINETDGVKYIKYDNSGFSLAPAVLAEATIFADRKDCTKIKNLWKTINPEGEIEIKVVV